MKLIFNALLLVSLLLINAEAIEVNSTGCGVTKMCLFKPKGCDPNLDCTIGVVLSVIGPNEMKVQMVAASIVPAVQQQYIAVAFSHDTIMGNDSVTECVIANLGEFAGYEPEVYLSYNKGKSNDRVFLNDDEHSEVFKQLSGESVDSRLVCEFTQQLVPQIDHKNGLVWNLNSPFYLMAATGSAQPDEVNAHEMNRESHFFPITSAETMNPAKFGNNFNHPSSFNGNLKTNRVEKRPNPPTNSHETTEPTRKSGASSLLLWTSWRFFPIFAIIAAHFY